MDDLQVRTVTLSGLSNGSTHEVSARALNLYGLEDEDSLTVVYMGASTLLSTSQPGDSSALPQLALDGQGRLHAVWQDACVSQSCDDSQEGNLPNDVFHRMLDADGWSGITLLSDSEGDDDSRQPVLATTGDGDVLVVWQDDGFILGSGLGIELYSRRFLNDSDSWSPVERVAPDLPGVSQRPTLAEGPDGSVYLAFELHPGDGTSSIALGQWSQGSWTTPEVVAGVEPSGASNNPALAVDSTGLVYLAWQEGTDLQNSGPDEDIFLATLLEGAVFTTTLVTDHPLDGASLLPVVAVDSQDVVHVVWQEDGEVLGSGFDSDLYHRAYQFGVPPTEYALITDGAQDGFSEQASLSVDLATDELYISWVETAPLYRSGEDVDVFLTRGQSTQIGEDTVYLFEVPVLVNRDGGFDNFAEFPDTLFDSQNGVLHIIWGDDSQALDSGEDQDIYYNTLQADP
jgi:hypothetical protein